MNTHSCLSPACQSIIKWGRSRIGLKGPDKLTKCDFETGHVNLEVSLRNIRKVIAQCLQVALFNPTASAELEAATLPDEMRLLLEPGALASSAIWSRDLS